MREAELRPVNSEQLIKLAHQISKHNSVSAPLTWQMGDPSRPFPQEHEFRAGHLLNPKTQSAGPAIIPGKSLAQKPLVTQVWLIDSDKRTIRDHFLIRQIVISYHSVFCYLVISLCSMIIS